MVKPAIFREEIYSQSFDTLENVLGETRHELSNHRDIIETSERIKHPEVKKESKDGAPEAHISRKLGSYTKAPAGAPFAKDSKLSNSGKTTDIKDVECFKYHKKGHYAGKGFFKVRQL